ncbi:crossover junction endonuclease EME1 [Periophthalmus magnuspinnatus]|uniref:crossover junction endonuclease EME1 n=1 Tax=Periophthalmus magnuspinnatus TaxID=409849 RepID=UPI00145A6E9E|nr:crossover junction endonuclease EME1 [Periophthalmus magnuspinnatus]
MDTDSNSDLDEEFPVFLTKPMQPLSPAPPHRQPIKSARSDVMTISSDSDDDAPYVPLALRLKQQQDARRVIPLCIPETSPNGFTEIVHLQHPNGQVGQSPVKSKAPPKRSVEEIQKSNEEAQRRKQAREKKQTEREEQRRRREEEKAQRRAMADAVKALRPEECIKYMVAVVDPGLLQLEGGGALLSSLQALGCTCAIEKQPLPRSVGWRRRTPGAQAADGDCVQENDVVIQMTVDDFISLSHNYIQEERTGRAECGRTLTSWVQELQRRHPEKILSLVVLGLEQYFRSHKAQSQKKLREAVIGEEQGGAKRKKKNGAANTLPELSRVEVEEAVVHLQLHTGVCVRFLSTWKDFTEHVTMATKAIAEAPFKRERDNSGFSFYLESEWAGGQKVERSGRGLLQVWKRQVQQLHRVSVDMASAVLASYPSPRLLTQAYSSCRTEKDKVALLSEIQIRRGEGVTSTVRRVGPELSKRLCVLLTSPDPEQTLGSNA